MPAKAAPSYHHGDLRAALVRQATALLLQRGAEACSLREVARQIGVSHAAAYAHFADKQALLAAVAVTGFEALAARLERSRLRHPESGEAALRAALRAYVEFCFKEPARMALMFGPRIGRAGKYPDLDRSVAQALACLTTPVEGLLGEGPLARRIAIDLWTFAHGYGTLSYNKRAHRSARAAAAAFDLAVTPMLLGLLASRKARKSPMPRR